MSNGYEIWSTILTIGSILLVTIFVIALAHSNMTTQTETFTGELCSIDDKKIVLCDGTVIFAKNTDNFEWQIGETYNIVRESHNTVLDVKIMHIKSITKEGVKKMRLDFDTITDIVVILAGVFFLIELYIAIFYIIPYI